MSDHSRSLRTLKLPHINADLTIFRDFCKVFEYEAINLTSLIIERIEFVQVRIILKCLQKRNKSLVVRLGDKFFVTNSSVDFVLKKKTSKCPKH
jgi:hypothetical protein